MRASRRAPPRRPGPLPICASCLPRMAHARADGGRTGAAGPLVPVTITAGTSVVPRRRILSSESGRSLLAKHSGELEGIADGSGGGGIVEDAPDLPAGVDALGHRR